MASEIYAQWPDLAANWRRGALCRQRPQPVTDGEPCPPGDGVLVTVGTGETPFDRLVAGSAALVAAGERVVVQRGASRHVPAGADVVEFLAFDAQWRRTCAAPA